MSRYDLNQCRSIVLARRIGWKSSALATTTERSCFSISGCQRAEPGGADPPELGRRQLPGSIRAKVVSFVYRPNPGGSGCFLLRKEVIHPHVPVGIPCYDLTPISGPALDASPLAVGTAASSIATSHGLTGGVYKPRERIHRDMLIRDY